MFKQYFGPNALTFTKATWEELRPFNISKFILSTSLKYDDVCLGPERIENFARDWIKIFSSKHNSGLKKNIW